MIDIISQPAEIRRRLYDQIGLGLGLHPRSVEKDLWVTSVLQALFSLPYANAFVFKGGSSLSKVWSLISRFSEDVDIAVDRSLFGIEGDVTKKQLKKLRKDSSLFVKERLAKDVKNKLGELGLADYCKVEPQPDGEGNSTYPEPRKIFISYDTAFIDDIHSYMDASAMLEIGARSLIEPTATAKVQSLISANSPVNTTLIDSDIITAAPEKTFLEKAFLLHELFATGHCDNANRKSRHLYDLECMMDKDFAKEAINDDELWENIRHHREIFTSVKDIDYSADIRKEIVLVPPTDVIGNWESDYRDMQEQMVYGDSLSFSELIERMRELEGRFHLK